jgi:predicted Zn-dependent peptidase
MAHYTIMSQIRKSKLENGMSILLIPSDCTDVVFVGIFVKVGSRFETSRTNGISHFLEHMMFKGTSNLSNSEISQMLDNVGAQYSAETEYEVTYYYIGCLL